MEILIWLAIIALPVGALGALVGAMVGLVNGRRLPMSVFSVVVVVSLTAWVSATLASGVRADETSTAGNIYSEVVWLLVAVVAGLVAAGLGLQTWHSRTAGQAAR